MNAATSVKTRAWLWTTSLVLSFIVPGIAFGTVELTRLYVLGAFPAHLGPIIRLDFFAWYVLSFGIMGAIGGTMSCIVDVSRRCRFTGQLQAFVLKVLLSSFVTFIVFVCLNSSYVLSCWQDLERTQRLFLFHLSLSSLPGLIGCVIATLVARIWIVSESKHDKMDALMNSVSTF